MHACCKKALFHEKFSKGISAKNLPSKYTHYTVHNVTEHDATDLVVEGVVHRESLLLHCLCCCTSVEVMVWLAAWSLHGEMTLRNMYMDIYSLRFFLRKTGKFWPELI